MKYDTFARTSAMIAALALLSGCSSFFEKIGLRAPQADVGEVFAEAQLKEGRAALDAGNYGAAIDAFRNAQHFERQAAAAHNGLGVAFAMIGRTDLAERYFKQAVLEAPTNTAIAANLDHFYRAAAAIQHRQEEASQLAEIAPEQQQVASNIAEVAVAPIGKLDRTSDREVHITLAPPQPAPLAVKTASTDGFGRRRNPAYPVRITLPDATPISAVASVAYSVPVQTAPKR